MVQTGPLREGTVTLLTAVDDVQRWSPVLLSAWLTPPSFTLGSRESVHIPVGAVADDGGFQNYLEPATSFQIQSRVCFYLLLLVRMEAAVSLCGAAGASTFALVEVSGSPPLRCVHRTAFGTSESTKKIMRLGYPCFKP